MKNLSIKVAYDMVKIIHKHEKGIGHKMPTLKKAVDNCLYGLTKKLNEGSCFNMCKKFFQTELRITTFSAKNLSYMMDNSTKNSINLSGIESIKNLEGNLLFI
jgi:hypothetical protein